MNSVGWAGLSVHLFERVARLEPVLQREDDQEDALWVNEQDVGCVEHLRVEASGFSFDVKADYGRRERKRTSWPPKSQMLA